MAGKEKQQNDFIDSHSPSVPASFSVVFRKSSTNASILVSSLEFASLSAANVSALLLVPILDPCSEMRWSSILSTRPVLFLHKRPLMA
jgi:hypothetical protein